MPQSEHDIRHAYNLASEAYAREFLDELRTKPADLQLLERFGAQVGSAGNVLDLGCGPGHTTNHLRTLGVQPIGVDLSPEMIAKAQQQFPQSQFEVGNFFSLKQQDATIDGILAFYCIVHLQLEQLASVVAEMFRVMSPGGVLLMSFHAGEGKVHVESFLDSGASLDFFYFKTRDVEHALATAGFLEIEVHERQPYDSEYPSRRCYLWARKPT